MRTIGVFFAVTFAVVSASFDSANHAIGFAQDKAEPKPQPELAIRMVVPEPDTYVSGVTTLKAEVLPRMLATRVAQILFRSEERRVGKESGPRGRRIHLKKNRSGHECVPPVT